MPLNDQFAAAQARVKTLTTRPSNQDLLRLYALYKQGTDGDVAGKKPSRLDLKGRAKFDAWTATKGLSTDDAKRAYVTLVDTLTQG